MTRYNSKALIASASQLKHDRRECDKMHESIKASFCPSNILYFISFDVFLFKIRKCTWEYLLRNILNK